MNNTADQTNTGKDLSVSCSLMLEHRLIERMIRVLDRAAAAGENSGKVTVGVLDAAVDLFKTYAALRHQGKEDYILFAELDRKELAPEHRALLRELRDEHAKIKAQVSGLAALTEQYKENGNGSLSLVLCSARALCKAYRAHIEKEDKRFYVQAINYFTREEQARLLERFREVDADIPDTNYKSSVEHFE